jgi:hypothetical protein
MRRSQPSIRGLTAAGAALLLSLGGTARAGLLDLLGGERETVGPFEISAHESSHWVGAWETRVQTTHYSIRHRGRMVSLTTPASTGGDAAHPERRFNAVVSFPSAQPALLVNAGYPYAASHFHLLRDDGGKLRVDYVGPVSSDIGNSAEDWAPPQWLEQQPRAVDPAPALFGRIHLEGGRWLIAGLFALLDTHTLSVHRLPFPPQRAYGSRILLRSPDGLSFVRLATGGDYPVKAHLIVFSLNSAQSYSLPIDAQRMRHSQLDDLYNPQWLDHHFEWRRDATHGDRLTERAAFTRLPLAGRIEGGPTGTEYHLENVDPAMETHFLRYVEQQFGGRRITHDDPAAIGDDGQRPLEHWRYIVVGETTIAMVYIGYSGELHVWRQRGPDTAIIDTVAAPFDAAVRAGKFD